MANQNYGYGGLGSDKMYGSDGPDQLHGDTLDPNPYDAGSPNAGGPIDSVDTEGGADWIKGYGGDDVIHAGYGND